MQFGSVRKYPQDVRTTVRVFRSVEVITGDARNIDIRTVVDDYDVFLAGRNRQRRITCRIEVDGVIVTATIALDLAVLNRLELDALPFQRVRREGVIDLFVDCPKRCIHIHVSIVQTEGTILHTTRIADIFAFIGRAKIHDNIVIVRVVGIATKIGDFSADKRTDLVLCACLTNHVAGQIQITANGDLSDGVNSRGIVLDKEVVVVEDVVKVVGPTILGVGFIRCFRHRAACGVCGNGAHAAEHHCKCCDDCE